MAGCGVRGMAACVCKGGVQGREAGSREIGVQSVRFALMSSCRSVTPALRTLPVDAMKARCRQRHAMPVAIVYHKVCRASSVVVVACTRRTKHIQKA